MATETDELSAMRKYTIGPGSIGGLSFRLPLLRNGILLCKFDVTRESDPYEDGAWLLWQEQIAVFKRDVELLLQDLNR